MGRRSSWHAETSDDDTFNSFSDLYGSTTSGLDDDTDYSNGYTFSEAENEEAEEESSCFTKMGYSTFDCVSPTNASKSAVSEEIEPEKKCTDVLQKNKPYDAQVRDDQSVRGGRSGT